MPWGIKTVVVRNPTKLITSYCTLQHLSSKRYIAIRIYRRGFILAKYFSKQKSIKQITFNEYLFFVLFFVSIARLNIVLSNFLNGFFLLKVYIWSSLMDINISGSISVPWNFLTSLLIWLICSSRRRAINNRDASAIPRF